MIIMSLCFASVIPHDAWGTKIKWQSKCLLHIFLFESFFHAPTLLVPNFKDAFHAHQSYYQEFNGAIVQKKKKLVESTETKIPIFIWPNLCQVNPSLLDSQVPIYVEQSHPINLKEIPLENWLKYLGGGFRVLLISSLFSVIMNHPCSCSLSPVFK